MKHQQGYYGVGSALRVIGGDNVLTCNLPFRLDTYLGCQHSCNYCYARYLLSFRKLWPEVPKPINVDELRSLFWRAFRRKSNSRVAWLLRKRFPLRLGADTDCFQPIERKFRVTEETLKILNEYIYPFVITTKSDLVAQEPYLNLIVNASGGAVVQFTIVSLDQGVLRFLEPKAPPVERRLDAAARLAEEDVYVQARFSPIIPGVNSDVETVKELFREFRSVGVKDVIGEFLRYRSQIRDWIFEASNGEIDLDKLFVEWGCSVKKDGRPRANFNGYVRVPFSIRMKMYRKYKEIAKSLGLNFYVCCDGSITINEGKNCCGTTNPELVSRYPYFRLCNSAAISTLLPLLKEKKKVTLKDVKKKTFCVDWKSYEKLWKFLKKYVKDLPIHKLVVL